MKWTEFWDMHSGGGCKEVPYENIYIEAPKDEAALIFYNRFGHSPHRVTCQCCGPDYSVSESETLEEATSYHRHEHDDYDDTTALEDYIKEPHVLVIKASEVKSGELVGKTPFQGWVWVDEKEG